MRLNKFKPVGLFFITFLCSLSVLFCLLFFIDRDHHYRPEPAERRESSLIRSGDKRKTNHSYSDGSLFVLDSLIWSEDEKKMQQKQRQTQKKRRKCNLFEGKWVLNEDDRYPIYKEKECSFLDEGFRCLENGRPDDIYTKWRWQPRHCNLTRFDSKDMLERLRNRRVVFVGDSIGRNQWESLLCMLSSSVADKTTIYEVNGSPITKHKGFLVFKFEEYNSTVEYYRSPFLVPLTRPPRGAPKKVGAVIRVDTVDWTSPRWRDADVLVFNTGHWWTYDKTIKNGAYFQQGAKVQLDMGVEAAHMRSMKTLVDWVRTEVNQTKTQVIYRTYSPVHFSGGDWKTGGMCHSERMPELQNHSAQKGKGAAEWGPKLKNIRDVLAAGKRGGASIDILNITWLTDARKDGHMSRYYLGPNHLAALHRQDCSHWCLPGVPDTWNELLYALFLRREMGLGTPRRVNTQPDTNYSGQIAEIQ